MARSLLEQIAVAQQLYKSDHGSYASLRDLLGHESMVGLKDIIEDHERYEFTVSLEDDSFKATARHRTRPDTRPAFVVDQNGFVRLLESIEEQQ